MRNYVTAAPGELRDRRQSRRQCVDRADESENKSTPFGHSRPFRILGAMIVTLASSTCAARLEAEALRGAPG